MRAYVHEYAIGYTLPDHIQTELIFPESRNYKTEFEEYISKTSVEGNKLTYL